MTYEREYEGAVLVEPDRSPEPDTETLLAELGAFYPVMSYPAEEDPEDAANAAIFAGLVNP